MTKKEKKAAYDKAYKEANKEKISARMKTYYKANKEKLNCKKKVYYEANKDKIKAKRKAYLEANKEKQKAYYAANKEKINTYSKAYQEANKYSLKAKRKLYYEANKEKIVIRDKAFYKANKDKINSRNKFYCKANKDKINKRIKVRRETDPIYKLKISLRGNILQSFKRKGFAKNSKTFEILGCDYDTFEKHIIDKFSEGMTLENHGEWHLDHQIPLALAETEEEVIELCHYTNYQPLWGKDNLEKNDKVRLENISFTNKARYIKFLNRI